jgi:phytoene dehydrogenase-like protein
MIARGGMGTVSRTFADAARASGARILTGTPVSQITLDGGVASGVVLADGRSLGARVVLGACDPYRLMDLVPDDALPTELTSRMAAVRRTGTTLKLNMALRGLPRFSCLPEDSPSPFGATIHLLPGSEGLAGDSSESPMAALRTMWADVQAGVLPAEPTIEWYLHTTVDPSLQDAAGHHSSALFVQSVPFEPAGSSWEAELPGYVDRLLDICERYAPGTRDLVADVMPLTPPGIEKHFGITGGHIHHVDNTVAFDERMPYFTGVDGLYAGSAGTHPAGSVIGAAGHNAAKRILRDLDVRA